MNNIVSERINEFIKAWNVKSKDYLTKNFPNLPPEKEMERQDGKRYAKLVRGPEGNRSVYCFIDLETGDIYKAAGWNAPAKGVRGSVMAEDYGMSIAGPYSVVYRRGPSFSW